MSSPQLIDALNRLREGLQSKKPGICGNAPLWVTQFVSEKLEKMMQETSGAPTGLDADCFARGASRFITDQTGSESDGLLRSLDKILKLGESLQSPPDPGTNID